MTTTTRIEVSAHTGKVKLDLGAEGGFAVLDPGMAVQIAKALMDAAQECGYEVIIQVPKRQITEAHRTRLITRAAHVMRSLESKAKPLTFIAAQVVDSVLGGIE